MYARKFYICVVVIACLSFVSNCFAAISDDSSYVAGKILIRFAAKTDGSQRTAIERNQILSSLNVGEIKTSYEIVPGLSLVELPKDVNVAEALSMLKNDPNFIYAEANYKIKAEVTEPNDHYFGDQWGLHNTGQGFHEGDPYYPSGGAEDADIDAPEAWDVNTVCADNIIVAVIDSGVDYTHSDLAANMWTNANGYHGYDFVNNDNYPMDDNCHGTHVAGVIGAVGGNGIGVAGICWRIKIMALKALDSNGSGDTAKAINAIDYAISKGAKILNSSWSSGGYSQSLKDAIERANTNGLLFIASAGNDGHNTDDPDYYHYPSGYDCNNIISVMATDRNDYLADGFEWATNYGLNTVDIAAPGLEIFSTLPTTRTAAMIAKDLPASYGMLDGTSMAAPYISGACALVWSHMKSQPPYDPNYMDVKNTILNAAEKLPAFTGKCATEGRLNLDYAIRGTIPVPMARITGGGAYNTIQKAINAATDDDEIVLDKGSFYEDVDVNSTHAEGLTIRSIDPDDPSIVANTLVSGYANSDHTFKLTYNEDLTIKGLTIYSLDREGVHIFYSTATISKCQISSGQDGQNLICSNHSTVNIDGCHISHSAAGKCGINSGDDDYLTVRNCQIYDCYCGVQATTANSVNIRNSTIVNNDNYGIVCGNLTAGISNCILWGNNSDGQQISGSNAAVTYSCIKRSQGQDPYPGQGNIKDNPNFVDSATDNFHLLFNSPCINAGNPNFTPLTGETDIDSDERILGRDSNGNLRVDMGADEYWVGDFNQDGIVNFKDFANLAKFWNISWSPPNTNYDPYNLYIDSGTQYINYKDLNIFASFWLSTNSTYVPDGGGDQMQGDGLGDDLESESLLDEDGQATISLVCDVNDPNEGDEVTVYVHTDMPLYALWYMDITVAGDADIIDAMNYYTIDCNAYGWSDGFALDSFIDDANGVVEIGGIAWPEEANDIVGYFTFRYNSGQVSASITDGWGEDNNWQLAEFSQQPLLFSRDPNEP